MIYRRIVRSLMVPVLGIGLLIGACSRKPATLEMEMPAKYEGQMVELMNYVDSTVVATATIENGKASFVLNDDGATELPFLANINIDGRLRAFYIAEENKAFLNDSLSVASGTPLNDRFAGLFQKLDSIGDTEDMEAYVAFARQQYEANKENPAAAYFAIECLKYAEPGKVDSLISVLPAKLKESKRVKYYKEFANRRALTAPGRPYADIPGKDARGKDIRLSDYVTGKGYTLVDFWASWCPYCIKELPDLAALYSDFHDKGLEIVGVAVRDKPEATRDMVQKENISWPVIYDTQKVPYDLYGFSGIPHHMLIDAEGVIVSRGESVGMLRKRLEELLAPGNANVKP